MQSFKIDKFLKISISEIKSYCNDILLGEIKNCDTVREIFSNESGDKVTYYKVFPSDNKLINSFSCAALCDHIKTYSQGGFDKTINVDAISKCKSDFFQDLDSHNQIFNFSFNLS